MAATLRTHLPTVKGLRPMIFAHVRSLLRRDPRHRVGCRAASHHAARRCRCLVPFVLASSLLVVAAMPVLADPSADGARSLPPPAADTGEQGVAPPADGGAIRATARPAVRPDDLGDLGAWLEYKHNSHQPALPDEARLFYHRGILAHRDGDLQQAIRLVRGAAELDPSFVTPHLALASWALTRDPSQALLRYGVVLDLVRRSFLLQIELVANFVFFTLHGLFLGLLITSLLVVLLHQAELRHIWHERLTRRLAPASAGVWTWILLLAPFAAGLGLALPAVVLMGMLWPLLRVRERLVFV